MSKKVIHHKKAEAETDEKADKAPKMMTCKGCGIEREATPECATCGDRQK